MGDASGEEVALLYNPMGGVANDTMSLLPSLKSLQWKSYDLGQLSMSGLAKPVAFYAQQYRAIRIRFSNETNASRAD